MIDVDTEEVLASGLVEKIGLEDGNLTHKTGGQAYRIEETIPDHTAALSLVVRSFEEHGPSLKDAVAVGHRAVHGGDLFREPVLIDQSVMDGMMSLAGLAPLHNPPGVLGMKAALAVLPDIPHVAIFDTAFFSTLPAEAYTYAIHAPTAKQYKIRKYGFHGTSHSFVSKEVAEFLGRDVTSFNQIVCHLGNGASISAVAGGVAVDTSMGLTPLAGLVMGTRSGDVDPGVFAYLQREAGMDSQAVDTLLNKKSGMAGLADGSSDFRDIWAKVVAGDENAQLAYDVYIHRLISYIGSYIAILGHVEAITFTAGVGENDQHVRASVIERLSAFGIHLDPELNAVRSPDPRAISTPDSSTVILVVPTNEELAMARETYQLISK
jgi:acetate kinase